MEDIPQPSQDPYSQGEIVQIYVGEEDIDNQYDGLVCEIEEVTSDELDVETGRPTDAYSYTLRKVKTGDKLPLSFRHRDLVPVNE